MSGDKISKKINKFVDKLKTYFEDELISVLIYGSYARGDYLKGFSDINILVLVNELSIDDLLNVSRLSGKFFNVRQAIFTPSILENSWDFFPLQWTEIKKHGIIVYGKDFKDEIMVSQEALKTQLGREARQFYFTMQGLVMERNYEAIFQTIRRQTRIIQSGLEYLKIKKVEFNYLAELENLMRKKLKLAFGNVNVMRFAGAHMETLEKTILILNSLQQD
ncbi:MAG: nucleotidyltransferase domain-containing protein [Candidatus Omnitrophica bacterium]|nr:nucleotidyltransferase domain-containing protein [Candidatus Omnitrophota bacterium]MCM8825680.1 nucleotidyltransferase domain-containing protein [Candidatus Omnitrophota bacterium]